MGNIALAVGRDKSTISREISRNTGGRGYRFKQADEKAKARRSEVSKAPKKLTEEMQSTIRDDDNCSQKAPRQNHSKFY